MRTEFLHGVRAVGRAVAFGAVVATLSTGFAQAQKVAPNLLRVDALVQPDTTPEEFVRLKRASAQPVAPSVIQLGEWAGLKSASVKREGVTQIGAPRASAATTHAEQTRAVLQWQTSARGGQIAALSFESSGALGMRLGVLIDKLPGSALLRVYSQNARDDAFEIAGQRVLQVLENNRLAGDTSDAARTWWTPGSDADELTLEIELPPGTLTSSVQLSVPSVLHFFEALSRPVANDDDHDAAAEQGIAKIGEASFCEQDATCSSDLVSQRNAVARMVFVESDGAYACTGTLVNDATSSATPYFLTAHHCIETQTVASTLQTYWFYRSPTCNASTLSPASRILKNGATLLYSAESPDVTLLRLNDTPPAGAVFAGWDAASMSRSAAVIGLHHPRGDLLKLSSGAIDGATTCTPTGTGNVSCVSSSATSMSGTYYRVKWSTGTTEGGSSGSGLFFNGALTGILSSGTGSCFANQAYTNYARFDVVYPALKKWLAAAPETGSETGSGAGTGAGTGSTASTRSAVYRFYNIKSGAHFYTISAGERDFVIQTYPEYQYENVAFYAYGQASPSKDAVYRFYNSQTGAHFYTINADERDFVVQTYPAFRLEGPVWYAQKAEGNGSTPIFRFYNTRTGAHFYTVNAAERDFVISEYKDFQYEGPVYHVWTSQ
ncbi:trypsin-like peptidase domain-containing protein [Diaphorobacter caeni]|uniref:trypsin-like peptidase domain-containing protein n=1 Tax=Diaphorobacter caeni TaxID=2784387 RepID=UPI00189057FE|nr:trypsin-like serine protease [Diaphorobacter caeni]MBF5002831.1 trypsin-like peptidase domain-containing protein [Diaphorobacter caeni]